MVSRTRLSLIDKFSIFWVTKDSLGMSNRFPSRVPDHTYSEIATILDKRGYKPGQGHRIDMNIVKGITHKYKLKTRFARLRAAHKLTVDEVASLLEVTAATVRRWAKKDAIKTYPYIDRNGCLYEHPGVNSPLMKKGTQEAESY